MFCWATDWSRVHQIGSARHFLLFAIKLFENVLVCKQIGGMIIILRIKVIMANHHSHTFSFEYKPFNDPS